MKCPKCGYNSFESYDSCKKCSADLATFKQTHGIASVVLPPSQRTVMAAELGGGKGADQAEEPANEMFSFELPTEQGASAPSPAAPADPFAFTDNPAPSSPAFSFDSPPPAPEDPFAALLESSPQLHAAPAAQPAAPQGLELNSFSWDDTPVPGQEGASAAGEKKSDDDDFNSLFGGLAAGDKK